MCWFIILVFPKSLPHFIHFIVLSLCIDNMWVFKSSTVLLQWSHLLGKPEWTLMICLFLFLISVKFFKQYWHLFAASLVFVIVLLKEANLFKFSLSLAQMVTASGVFSLIHGATGLKGNFIVSFNSDRCVKIV